MPLTPESLRNKALAGDKQALDDLIGQLAPVIHRITTRMLWDSSEAEDATQEVLIKIITKLDSFDGRSSLSTWVHRITVNHVLDRRRHPAEALTFDQLAADLRDGLADPSPVYQPELEALADEVKATCTGAMLLCLDRPHRLAYILGEILELPGPVASEIVGVSPATFRKRLSRARSDIRAFMSNNCSLVEADAPCRCPRRVNRAVELGRVSPAGVARSPIISAMNDIEQLQSASSVMRSVLGRPVPDREIQSLRSSIDASSLLNGAQA